MADAAAASNFPESTSKICWFNLSSLLFKSASASSTASSTGSETQLQANDHDQSTTSSSTSRRTSPRLSSVKSDEIKNSTSSNSTTAPQSHCCLLNASNSNCNCSQSKKTSKSNNSTASNRINNKKQRQTQNLTKDDHEDESDPLLCHSTAEAPSNGLNDHVSCQGHRHDKKLKHGLSAKEAPEYLTFNPYITGGYRNNLAPIDCMKSLFWWTNETLNIWSHLLGWVFFFTLSIYDMMGLINLPKTQPWDQAIFSLLLVCFQACMILSAAYHVFCCCSEKSYRQWLTMDLLGVSLSLLAIYISGIYYAFSCVPSWLNFYLSTVAAIFVCCLTCTFLRSSDGFSNRLILFGGWACYGIVPTVHWAILHGGMKSPAVALLLPRIFWMYAISAAAFFFYVSKLPERLRPGWVNYIGSSHQIWHILIVAALYHWHNTGLIYLEYRALHPCTEEYAQLYPSSATVE